MKELETLLNSLIKMGWKPWGNLSESMYFHGFTGRDKLIFECPYLCVSLRELVSQESGLWQFCEENGLLHEYYNWRTSEDPYKCYWTTTYEYRLIESALVPEEELVEFLLENIKIEGITN